MFVRKEVGQKKKKQLFPNKEIYFSEREEFVYKENKNNYQECKKGRKEEVDLSEREEGES